MKTTIDASLKEMDSLLIEMGDLCVRALSGASIALATDDKELARIIKKSDEQINDLESKIDAISVSILLREQPFAKDLRHVIAAIKMVTDMERIGDQAANIADIIYVSELNSKMDVAKIIEEMADKSCKMVSDSIHAFVCRDIELTRQIIEADDEIDNLFSMAKIFLAENSMNQMGETQNRAIDSIMITKYLERIADHATNIAEWVEFAITGVHPSYGN